MKTSYIAGAALAALLAAPLGAQESLKSSFDRTVVPKPAPAQVKKVEVKAAA